MELVELVELVEPLVEALVEVLVALYTSVEEVLVQEAVFSTENGSSTINEEITVINDTINLPITLCNIKRTATYHRGAKPFSLLCFW